jgi:phosphoglycerate dehydrogenase-like enzyme
VNAPIEAMMPSTYRVVIADFLDESSVETPILGDIAEIVLGSAWKEEDLSEIVTSADAILLYHDIPRMGDATFSRATRLQGVVRAGVGYNNVDLDAASRRGIAVCNVPDYGTEEVADHAILMLLAVARQLRQGDEAIRQGTWDFRTVKDAPRLRGKTLGLVGCGRIGTATALRAKAFGLDVAFFDPYAPPGLDKALGIRRVDSLDALLPQSAFLSLHCFLDDQSRHLINFRTLSLLPRGAILINTARGGVVENEALLEALDSGQLAGAGLDVVEREPLDDEQLRHHPKVILSPHSAFYSLEGFIELRRKAAEEVRRLLTGQPLRCPVNQEGLIRRRSGSAV